VDRNEDMRIVNGQIYTRPIPMPISEVELHIRRQAFLDLKERLRREGRTAWDNWGPEIEIANQRLATVETINMDGPGLADLLEETTVVISRNIMYHPMMGFKPGQAYFKAFEALSGLSGKESETAAYRLLELEETPLTRLIDKLYALAEVARKIPSAADWIRGTVNNPQSQVEDVFATYPKNVRGASNWLNKFEVFIAEFGDRSGHGYGSEVLISTPTWRDQPILALQLVERYLDETIESPREQRHRTRRAIDAEVAALCSRCDDKQIVEAFLTQLEIARRNFSILEIHNHHIEQVGHGLLRRAVMAAASWLQSKDVISIKDEIFWLTFKEIMSELQQPNRNTLEKKINLRKMEYRIWKQFEPPPYLGLPSAKLPPRSVDTDILTPLELEIEGDLHGVGASKGVVNGRARVIKTWESSPKIMPGDILIAENAGPMWTPFFPILGGLVLEIGSLGQHAASTAREYGIPAVIGLRHARQLIKDGNRIQIDGEKGTVELCMDDL
jgi:pyruvate,water dikinase